MADNGVDHGRPARRRRTVATSVVIASAVMLLCAACAATKTAADKPKEIYVSLGDSYAAGVQPTGPYQGAGTRHGFAYQVVGLARQRGYDLELVNFGCGGATTSSLTRQKGCLQPGPGGVKYPKTSQLAAALAYLRAHRSEISLVTISIGGNDVTPCAKEPDLMSCVRGRMADTTARLGATLRKLRAAVDRKTLIVGTTYPDVFLGGYVDPSPAAKALAEDSVAAFKTSINPSLQLAYQQVGATLVDVTSATGAYTPLNQTTTLAPYGTVPIAVAQACELTYFCQYHDIHPRTAGYRVIADLVARQLPTK